MPREWPNSMDNSERNLSLDKGKIMFLLLEGINKIFFDNAVSIRTRILH